MPKVVVYLQAADARALEAAGEDPKLWVRKMVKKALEWQANQTAKT